MKEQEQNMPLSIISQVIRKLMEEKGMTQEELAAASGCSQSDISRYLRGREPGAKKLAMLARGLDVSVEVLMNTSIPILARPTVKMLREEPDYEQWRRRALAAESRLEELKKAVEATLKKF